MQSTQELLPMTAKQGRAIAKLCSLLRIKQPIEERIQSQAEAGKAIRELRAELKYQRMPAEDYSRFDKHDIQKFAERY